MEKNYAHSIKDSGISLRCEKNIDLEVKRSCREFCRWIQRYYYFPIRIPIYLLETETIEAMDGEKVSATFWGAYDCLKEPYIRIATGDYEDNFKKYGKDNALAANLCSIIHELTHYFQWINGCNMEDEETIEAEVEYYVDKILQDYADSREHP